MHTGFIEELENNTGLNYMQSKQHMASLDVIDRHD